MKSLLLQCKGIDVPSCKELRLVVQMKVQAEMHVHGTPMVLRDR